MLFKHAEIFTPQGFVRGAFTVEDGRFGEILPQSPDMPGTDPVSYTHLTLPTIA